MHSMVIILFLFLLDYRTASKLYPNEGLPRREANRLEPLAKAQQEQEMNEMIGKLKDLGNSILGKFGLSTDNFKVQKDEKTGSYSINFQQNPSK